MKNRITMAGFAAAVLGLMLVFGQSFGQGPGSAQAGGGTADPTADPTVNTATSIPATCVPGQTCPNTATPNPSETPGRAKTHTPTSTPTDVPSTSVPATEPAATSTVRPSSGNEGANVKPPATGSGDGTGSRDQSLWILVAGAMLVIVGGGAALVGIRQRR
jgi:hypothetical protein